MAGEQAKGRSVGKSEFVCASASRQVWWTRSSNRALANGSERQSWEWKREQGWEMRQEVIGWDSEQRGPRVLALSLLWLSQGQGSGGAGASGHHAVPAGSDQGRRAAAEEGWWETPPPSTQQVCGRASSPERGAWAVLRPLLGTWWIIKNRVSTAECLSSEVLPCLASGNQRRHSGGMFLGLQGCLLLPVFPDLLLHPGTFHKLSLWTTGPAEGGVLPPSASAELWAGAPLLSAVELSGTASSQSGMPLKLLMQTSLCKGSHWKAGHPTGSVLARRPFLVPKAGKSGVAPSVLKKYKPMMSPPRGRGLSSS